MGQTAEQKRAKRAANAETEGRTVRSYRRRTADATPSAAPASGSALTPPAPLAPSTLPGNFNVGDRLVYKGEDALVQHGGRTVNILHGMRCDVIGPAKESMRQVGVSVRFHLPHLAAGTFSVSSKNLDHPRPNDRLCCAIVERVTEPVPQYAQYQQRLREHGFVDGSLFISDDEDTSM